MSKKLQLFAAALAVAMAGGAALSAQGPNGTTPRPFYVIAHNPNTLQAMEAALFAGANALEPDVIVLPESGCCYAPGLVVYHDYTSSPARIPLSLDQYLEAAHSLAQQYPWLAMIQLDVKHEATVHVDGPSNGPVDGPANGQAILTAVRNHLNYGGVNLVVIINVGSFGDAVLFKNIYSQLGEREGVSIDGEDDPTLVVKALEQAANDNISYGDGTAGPGPHLVKAVDWGSFLKASWGVPKTIGDVYTIAETPTMDFFIEAGADGIIADHFPTIPPFPGLAKAEFDKDSPLYTWLLASRVNPKDHPEIRYATPEDNPFKPDLEAYGIETHTRDVDTGGTDAPLTFTLEGCRGTSKVTFHTGVGPNWPSTGRMERGETDHVTIPSLNLGKLTTLHIKNEGGAANAPDWALGDVAVSSARWIGPDRYGLFEYRGTFNGDFIHDGETKSVDLLPFFQEPEPTIDCPAPITVNNAPGQCNAVVNFAPKVDGMCPDVTASSNPPSGSSFAVGTTGVTSTAASPTFPTSHPMCTFTVTVKDVEKPSITCPAPMTVDATSPLGVAVTFAPTAGDNCSATVSSVPASGSMFAIGTTPVTSTAQDPSGNQSSCGFTVHVKGAAEQLADLIGVVTSLAMKAGTKNALLVKLNAALAQVQAGQTTAVCGILGDFISLVSAQSGKDIAVVDADALIAKATQIRAVMGC